MKQQQLTLLTLLMCFTLYSSAQITIQKKIGTSLLKSRNTSLQAHDFSYIIFSEYKTSNKETNPLFCFNTSYQNNLTSNYKFRQSKSDVEKPSDKSWTLINAGAVIGYGVFKNDSLITGVSGDNAGVLYLGGELFRFAKGFNFTGGLGIGTVGFEYLTMFNYDAYSVLPIYLYLPLYKRSVDKDTKRFLYLFGGGTKWAFKDRDYLHEGVGYLISIYSVAIELRGGLIQSNLSSNKIDNGWYIGFAGHIGAAIF